MVVELREQPLRAGGQGVFEPEVGQQPAELRKIDAVIARVLADLAGIDDRCPRHETTDDVGDVAHLIVLDVAADIDRLVVDRLARRLEKRDKGAGDIAAVDQRPPWRAVAHDADVTLGDRASQQVVDHQIDAQHRRVAIGGRVAQKGRREIPVGERGDALLGNDLRLGIDRYRVHLVLFGERPIFGLAVDRAARREQKPRHAGRLGLLRQGDRAAGVDVAGDLRIEIAHRVVRDRRQMHHAILAFEVAQGQRPHVADDLAIGRGQLLPVAALEQVEIAAGDVMPRLPQQLDEMGADIAAVTGDENLHLHLPLQSLRGRGLPGDQHGWLIGPAPRPMAPAPIPTALSGARGRAEYPCRPRNRDAGTPRAGRRGRAWTAARVRGCNPPRRSDSG